MSQEVVLFPDTNVFMHFDMFDEIKWSDLVGGSPVLLVISQKPIITELDKHKNGHRSSRKRDRARKVLAKIRTIHETKDKRVRDLVKLRVHTVNPPEVQGLDPNDPDDRLVASAIYYESRYGKKPMIVTGDFGVRFTAEAHEFPLLILPDNLRLPDEPDEKDEELRKLKVENEKLRVQTPRLRLRYTDGKPVLAVRIFHEGDMSDEKILDLAYDAVDEHDTDGWSDKAVSDLVSRVQRKLYALRTWNKTDRYTFPLQLELANEGAAPAVDVDVAVRVPTHFTLLLRRDKRPEVPPGLVPESSIRPYSDEWDTSAPQWSKVSDVEAQYKIERVAQGDVVKPPPLFLRLKDRDNLQGFQIEARVRAGNVPGVDEMELSVTLR